MGEHPRHCIKCGGITQHRITYDYDSAADEPEFVEECLRCLGENKTLEPFNDPNQQQLTI